MEFKCEHCNKIYKSYQSRWNHYKKCSSKNVVVNNTTVVIPVVENVVDCSNSIKQENNICKYCNKELCDRTYRWRHEKKCSKKNDITKENAELKLQISEIIEYHKKEMEEIKKILKIHPKTLQKINKELSNSSNINNGNINNGTVNNTTNNYIIPLSEQNLVEVLSENEKIKILRSGSGTTPHIQLLNTIYKDPKYKKYRNVYVTNLANNYAHIFDDNENKYIIDTKENIMDKYGDYTICDIQDIYKDEIKEKVPVKILNKVERFCDKYFDDEIFKKKIKEEMILNLYNNQNNVKRLYDDTNKNTLEL